MHTTTRRGQRPRTRSASDAERHELAMAAFRRESLERQQRIALRPAASNIARPGW